MSMTLEQKVDYLFKLSKSKSRGDNTAEWFEENIPSSYEVHANDVFIETIPLIPPIASTEVIKRYYDDTEGRITLTMDHKYNGGRVWVALPTRTDAWSSGSGDTTEILTNFVNPKYGKGYVVKVYDGTGVAIPELDSSSWTFNYRSGVLTFEVDRIESGTSLDSISIQVFRYIGQTLTSSAGAVLTRASMLGVVDGINTVFRIPDNWKSDLFYQIHFNGQNIYVGADYTLNETDPYEITMLTAPSDNGNGNLDRLDVVYYPQ